MALRWTRNLHWLTILAVLARAPVAGGQLSAPAPPGTSEGPVEAGCEPDYPPYCIVTRDQQADGFSVELLRAALKAVGLEVTFRTGPWPEIKQDLADGRLRALPLVGRTPEREAIYDFTFPYLTMHGAIVVRQDSVGIRGPADLKGRRVAVLQGDNAEEYLRRADLGAVIVPLPSFETALRELSAGKHDAVVMQKLVAFQLMDKIGLSNLRTAGPPLKAFTQSFCFAVRRGDSALLAALNEGLAIVIADGTFRRLSTKWFSTLESMGRSKSRIVVGGDSDYPPYEFLDTNGQPAGFNVDLTQAIAREAGVSVEILLGPWANIRRGLETGEIDVAEGMFYSIERDRTFDFSPQHSVVQHSIVVRRGTPVPADLRSLGGKSTLVMAGDVMHDLALGHGLQDWIVAVPTQEEALRRLAAGTHDCALVARIPALYWIEKNRWRNLQVSDRPVLSAEYCYAVPHGREELLAVFSEGLAALKLTGEFHAIQSRWLGPYEEPRLGLVTIARWVGVPILLLLMVLAVSILWSRSLKRQVVSRTAELTAEVAERKRAEEGLRHAQKMEAVGNLAGGVAHDFNNLLQAMLSQTQSLRSRPADSEHVVEHALELEQQIQRGAALTRQLLLFSRRETVKRERLDLNDAVQSTMLLVRRLIRANIALTVDLADEALPVVADRGQLQQVLMNLAVNASDAMPEGGGLAIRTGYDGASVWLEVADSGHGIPEEIRARILEPFFTTKAAGKGTGLGLSVVHGIVTQHGGAIEFDSGAHQGATFRVTLPRAAAGEIERAAEPAASAPGPEQGRGELVLVVEDEGGARDGLREILSVLGYNVLAAVASGEEALLLAHSPAPDLLLTDFMLPGVTGPELAATLAGRWPGLRVILMSGYTWDEAVRQEISAGIVRYLQKPFDMSTLARELRAAFDDPPG